MTNRKHYKPLLIESVKVPVDVSVDTSGKVKAGVNFKVLECGKSWDEIKAMNAKKFAKLIDVHGMQCPDNKYQKVSQNKIPFNISVGGYIEGNVLVVDENRDVIALYEGDKENNRLICNRVLKERD